MPLYRKHLSKVPNDWQERLVVVWEEDDAPVPDKERVDHAFERIVGRRPSPTAWKVDMGDYFAFIEPSGWVKTHSYDGGEVGFISGLRMERL